MLHGCTQSPDDFAAGTRMNFIAEEQNCLVVYPAQRSDANPSKCWNWFRSADQQRGAGRTLADRRHHPPGHAGLFGRSQARLRRRPFGRRRRCGHHGRDLQRSVRRGRNPFRPGLRSRHRHALSVRRHASGEQPVAKLFRAGRSSRPLFSTATATPPCILTMATKLSNRLSARRGRQKKVHRGQIPGGHAYTRTTLRRRRT